MICLAAFLSLTPFGGLHDGAQCRRRTHEGEKCQSEQQQGPGFDLDVHSRHPFLARSIGSNTSRPVTDNLPRIARHASVQDLSIVSIQRTENIGYTDGK